MFLFRCSRAISGAWTWTRSEKPRRPAAAWLFFAVMTAAGTAAASTGAPSGFQTAAASAILIDADGDSVLFEKNADELVAPASLAKLMTVEVVFNELKNGRLHLHDEFPVSETAWRRGGAPSRTSSMFAPIHSRVSVADLLRGAIIQSGNDACIALAEGIAGSEERFAEKMTARARELGLTRSVFTNSTGLPDPGLKATVRELARLAQHIIATYPDFYAIYREPEFTWNKIRQLNRNPLLAMNIGADGMKTGYTAEAGYNLVGSALQNGMRLVLVISGTKSDKERADEGRRLLEWGFNSFEQRILFGTGQPVGDAKVYGGTQGSVPLLAPGPVRVMVPKAGNEKIVARIVYQGPLQAPVRASQPAGVLRVSRNDIVALEVPLHTAEEVAVGGLPGRAVDAAGEIFIHLFRAGLQRL